MPLINLIAVQRLQKRQMEQRIKVLFVTWIVEVAIVLLVVGFILGRTAMLEAQIGELNARAQKLKPNEDLITTMRTEINQLKPKLEILTTARKDTDRWRHLLSHLSVNMPPGTWLTGLKSEAPKDTKSPHTFSITGSASDQNLVGEIMIRLNSFPDIASVDLKFSQVSNDPSKGGVDFEINSTLKMEQKPTETANKEDKNGSS